MIFRTDLATEAAEIKGNKNEIINETKNKYGIKENYIEILSRNYAEKIGKKAGKYISYETDAVIERQTEEFINISKAIADGIDKLITERKNILVVGLGNESMTPDSIGPKVIKKVFVTRHIFQFLPDAVDKRMASVCAFAPGVLGVTGIESKDIISGICKNTDISAIIVIDALAARRSERMFSTFQLTDTGIEPGAGVGNKRSAISFESLGVPVIAIGIPTVVYASSLVYDSLKDALSLMAENEKEEKIEETAQRISSFSSDDMVVTPKEIDIIAEDCAKIIADGINLSLHKNMTLEEISGYMF